MTKDEALKKNICLACGRPRGAGRFEFAHGNCFKKLSAMDKTTSAIPDNPKLSHLTVEQFKKAKDNNRRKSYLSGKIAKWMLY